MSEIKLEGKLLKRRWRLLRCIGMGAFGQVYSAVDLNNDKKIVAIKLEENKKVEKLKSEALIVKYLTNDDENVQGFPKVYWYGTDTVLSQFNYMVTDILGPSLEDLFNICQRKFSLKTVLMIVDQCLSRIEYVHHKHYIHRDVKPENFLMGLGNNSHLINAIDFGLSQKYRDSKTLCHIMFKENRSLVGTARYLSLNAHLGIEQSRRDDLESLGYMLIYFLKGTLPWQGIDSPNKLEKYQKIGEKKLKLPVEFYCCDIPEEFTIYMNYCRNLLFDEKPDYTFLKQLFNNLFISKGYVKDYRYDWTDPTKVDVSVIDDKGIPLIYTKVKKHDEQTLNSNEESLSGSDSFTESEHNIYNNEDSESKGENTSNKLRKSLIGEKIKEEEIRLNKNEKKPSIFKNYQGKENQELIDRIDMKSEKTLEDESIVSMNSSDDSDTIEESDLIEEEDLVIKEIK